MFLFLKYQQINKIKLILKKQKQFLQTKQVLICNDFSSNWIELKIDVCER